MPRLPAMIDLHAQLLPGIGDGAPSWDDALAMAEIGTADGISAIVCTAPLAADSSRALVSRIRSRTRDLQLRLREIGNRTVLLPGGRARIDDATLKRLHDGALMTVADQGRHLLLDLPVHTSMSLDNWLAQLTGLGVTGILSQPERWPAIGGDLQLVERLVASGALVLVGSHSLLGHHGPTVKQRTLAMLKAGLAHFVASAACDPRSRPPLLGRAYEMVRMMCGDDRATALFCTNPSRVLLGEMIDSTTPLTSNSASKPTSFWNSWRRVA